MSFWVALFLAYGIGVAATAGATILRIRLGRSVQFTGRRLVIAALLSFPLFYLPSISTHSFSLSGLPFPVFIVIHHPEHDIPSFLGPLALLSWFLDTWFLLEVASLV